MRIRDSHRSRLRILCACVLPGAFAGCAIIQPLDLPPPSTEPRTVTYVVHPKPSFTAMTADKAVFAMLGVGAAISEGREWVDIYAIPDPAVEVSLGLMQALERSHGMRLAAPPIASSQTDAASIASAARGHARYVLDVSTTRWGFSYFPALWTRYWVPYQAQASLIDTESGKIVAQATCRSPLPNDVEGPTYDEMLKDKAASLKKMLSTAAASCLDSLWNDMAPGDAAKRRAAATPPAAAAALPVLLTAAPSLPTIPLDGNRLAGQTWRFEHPANQQVFGYVEMSFKAGGRIDARNRRSSTTGRYEVQGGTLCATYDSTAWGKSCYVVPDRPGEAVVLRSTASGSEVPFEVCSQDGRCTPATPAAIGTR